MSWFCLANPLSSMYSFLEWLFKLQKFIQEAVLSDFLVLKVLNLKKHRIHLNLFFYNYIQSKNVGIKTHSDALCILCLNKKTLKIIFSLNGRHKVYIICKWFYLWFKKESMYGLSAKKVDVVEKLPLVEVQMYKI